MRALLILLLLMWPMTLARADGSAHAFHFTAIEEGGLPLSGFKGKPVLVVNTASLCGFTPQCRGLQSLHERYGARGLIVIGVPSNDFGGQEPGSDQEIRTFCAVNFAVTFPMTTKEKVTGPHAHPFYRWAAEQKGAPQWNFHKYLLDGDGRLVAAFSSPVAPESPALAEAIEAVLPR